MFVYEWLTATRRWQLYALRRRVRRHDPRRADVSSGTRSSALQLRAHRLDRGAGRYGEAIYRTIVIVELTLILLAAPAATAGAICLDKARGTLDHMLATDLSNAEIVLGKLGVRLIPGAGPDRLRPARRGADLAPGRDRPAGAVGSFLTAIGCAFVGARWRWPCRSTGGRPMKS